MQCALRTTAALQDGWGGGGGREYAARQNIYDAPEHKGEAQIKKALIVKYPLDALSHQHYQLSLVITCCSVYTYYKHLKKEVDRFMCRETKKCLFNILHKNVHTTVLRLIYFTIPVVILQNVVKQNQKGINGRRQ